MTRRAFLIAGALLPTGAAIAQTRKPSERAEQPLEFKGVPLGASVQDFLAKHDYFSCLRGSPCEIFYLADLPERQIAVASYAGERVRGIKVEFIDGEMAMVSIEIYPHSFESIISVMASRYGKPRIRVTKIPGRAGATLEAKDALWSRSNGHLMASKYEGPDGGSVTMATKKWIDKINKESSSAAARAQKDL